MELLKQLCQIKSPAGEEINMTSFLLNYIDREKKNWHTKPQILFGDGLQDSLLLIFGKPKTAIFAHIDTIGFTVRYSNQLIKIGAPLVEKGTVLIGSDSKGSIETEIDLDKEQKPYAVYPREIERGTSLTFKPDFKETEDFVQSPYLDNRLGVYAALKVAEELENGVICFTCWEEHGGGSAENVARILYEKYHLRQALISDITWITEGIKPGKGVAISMRDSGIPRRSYVKRIIDIANKFQVPYQIEVEASGGSDGNSLQKTSYPIDWCFIGAAEDNVHSPREIVHKKDIASMINLYKILMREL